MGKLEDLLLERQLIKCFCWAGRALTAAKSFYNSLKVRRLIVRPSISIKVVARNYFGHLVKLDTHLSEGLCHFHKTDNSLTLLNKKKEFLGTSKTWSWPNKKKEGSTAVFLCLCRFVLYHLCNFDIVRKEDLNGLLYKKQSRL